MGGGKFSLLMVIKFIVFSCFGEFCEAKFSLHLHRMPDNPLHINRAAFGLGNIQAVFTIAILNYSAGSIPHRAIILHLKVLHGIGEAAIKIT